MGAAPVAHLNRGPSVGSEASRGACRSERLVSRQHPPAGFGEPAGNDDRGDSAAALLAEPLLGRLVELAVGRRAGGVLGGLDQRPPEIAGAILGQRAAAVALTRLVDARAQSGVGD